MNGHNTTQREALRMWRERCGVVNSSREIAYQYIRDRILDLEFYPGMSLNDKALAEELDMSRTPVREALILLNAGNLVVAKPQSGTYVAPISTFWLELEQYQRLAIEKEVVAEASGKISPKLAELYESLLAEYEQLCTKDLSEENVRQLIDLDNKFHGVAYTAAGRDDVYFSMLDSLQHIERFRWLSIRLNSAPVLHPEHRAIAEAIIGGNAALAVQLLEDHMNRYKSGMAEIKEAFADYFELK